MKKLLLILTIFFLPTFVYASDDINTWVFSPSSPNTQTPVFIQVTGYETGTVGQVLIFPPSVDYTNANNRCGYMFKDAFFPSLGSFHIGENYSGANPSCDFSETGLWHFGENNDGDASHYNTVTSWCNAVSCAGGGGGGGLTSVAGLIESASTTLFSNLGFGLGDIEDIMKSNMLLVFGSAAGLVQALLPFIIILVSIALIISVIYLGFKFFRH